MNVYTHTRFIKLSFRQAYSSIVLNLYYNVRVVYCSFENVYYHWYLYAGFTWRDSNLHLGSQRGVIKCTWVKLRLLPSRLKLRLPAWIKLRLLRVWGVRWRCPEYDSFPQLRLVTSPTHDTTQIIADDKYEINRKADKKLNRFFYMKPNVHNTTSQ